MKHFKNESVERLRIFFGERDSLKCVEHDVVVNIITPHHEVTI